MDPVAPVKKVFGKVEVFATVHSKKNFPGYKRLVIWAPNSGSDGTFKKRSDTTYLCGIEKNQESIVAVLKGLSKEFGFVPCIEEGKGVYAVCCLPIKEREVRCLTSVITVGKDGPKFEAAELASPAGIVMTKEELLAAQANGSDVLAKKDMEAMETAARKTTAYIGWMNFFESK